MILGEVLGLPVVQDGRRVGVVVDARFVLRGAAGPGTLAAPELVGLVVGPRRGTAFLGYERRSVRPALLQRLLAWRQRGSFLADVGDLEVTSDGVVLRAGATRWSAGLPG